MCKLIAIFSEYSTRRCKSRSNRVTHFTHRSHNSAIMCKSLMRKNFICVSLVSLVMWLSLFSTVFGQSLPVASVPIEPLANNKSDHPASVDTMPALDGSGTSDTDSSLSVQDLPEIYVAQTVVSDRAVENRFDSAKITVAVTEPLYTDAGSLADNQSSDSPSLQSINANRRPEAGGPRPNASYPVDYALGRERGAA